MSPRLRLRYSRVRMQGSPAWLYDEFRGFALDFHDPHQVEHYEARQGTDLEAETQLVRSLGISKKDTLIEYGAGTCAFVEAAAKICRQVHAVDVSLAMIEFAHQRLRKLGLTNLAFHHAGFLTYEHRDEHASSVITKFALHHLPDFWKVVALVRINRRCICPHVLAITFYGRRCAGELRKRNATPLRLLPC